MERVIGSRFKKTTSIVISVLLVLLLLSTFFWTGNHNQLRCRKAQCSTCIKIEKAQSIINHIKIVPLFTAVPFLGISFGIVFCLAAGREEETLSLVRLKIRMDD